jgi:hypothetical protein
MTGAVMPFRSPSKLSPAVLVRAKVTAPGPPKMVTGLFAARTLTKSAPLPLNRVSGAATFSTRKLSRRAALLDPTTVRPVTLV